MSFCTNCGCELTTTTNFCPNCGAGTGNTIVAVKEEVVATSISKRDMTLNEISILYNYFLEKNNEFNEFDLVNNKIGKIKKLRNILGGLVFFAIIGFFSIFQTPKNEIIENILGTLVSLAALGSEIAIFVFLTKKIKKLQNRSNELNQILTQHYEAYNNCPIGIEYSRPEDITKIYDVVRSGRAETIPEAINLIIDDMHKAKMEHHAAETAAASKETARAAKAAARNTFLNLLK